MLKALTLFTLGRTVQKRASRKLLLRWIVCTSEGIVCDCWQKRQQHPQHQNQPPSQLVEAKTESTTARPDYPRSPDFVMVKRLRRAIPCSFQQPNIRLVNAADYRDTYANSIQIRVSVWDFLLVFGRLQPVTAQEVELQNFQGIYLSPQQAKALLTILEQNVRQYEGTFGEIKLDPSMATQQGQIN
jgi:flagellar protein FlaG